MVHVQRLNGGLAYLNEQEARARLAWPPCDVDRQHGHHDVLRGCDVPISGGDALNEALHDYCLRKTPDLAGR